MTVYPVVAYVSGPYRAATISGIHRNIQRAREVGIALWQMGIPALVPHLNTAFFDGEAPDEVWLKGDLIMLERCNLIVMVPGWENSVGARGELEHAREEGIPAFRWPEDREKVRAFVETF